MKCSIHMNPIDHLLTKNIERIYPSEEAFAKMLRQKKPLKIYLGIDPSSSEIHIGHSILLSKLSEFQNLGHKVILLIGDFTGMIGDPTGKDKSRIPLSREQVKKNAKTYQKQAAKFLNFSGKNPAEIRYNSSWLDKLNLKEIITLLSSFTLQQLLERDMFQKRLSENLPIGLHEFLYPIFQGYDSVALKVDVEIGGTDQTFNMLIGRDLSKGKKFVLTLPLLPGLNGMKMSKSLGNTVSILDNPKDMYGKLMSLSDGLILSYFGLLTEITGEELNEMENSLKSKRTNPRNLKARLAKELVTFYHGEKKAQAAEGEFNTVFRDKKLPGKMPEMTFLRPSDKISAQELIKLSKLAPSNQTAWRLLSQGGVEVNERKVQPKEIVDIASNFTVIKFGKHSFLKIIWAKR